MARSRLTQSARHVERDTLKKSPAHSRAFRVMHPLCAASDRATVPAMTYSTALIVGAGSGLSASLARLFAGDGMKVALAARSTEKLAALTRDTGAQAFACDASRQRDVEQLFATVEAALGAPDVVVYNASFRTRGPFVDLDPADVEKAAFWWRSRRRGACCRRGRVRSSSPAHRPA
jgi:hypothetical protein